MEGSAGIPVEQNVGPEHRRVFLSITGQWELGSPDGFSEIVVNPLDAVSVPRGVMRGVQNVGDSEAVLLVIFSAPEVTPAMSTGITTSPVAPRTSATP
jgi:quercetin dioxygenase-like cupin family protein